MYLRTNIKNNLKTILRDPKILLSLLAAIIMYFMHGIESVTHGSLGRDVYFTTEATELFLGNITNFTATAVNISFVFLGVVIAVDIFRERANMMSDLYGSGQISFKNHYISKLLTYYILGFAFCIGVLLIHDALYMIFIIPWGASVHWGAVTISHLVCLVVMYTSSLWMPIGTAVFLSALTGISVIGTLFNCIYQYIPEMFGLGLYSFYVGYIEAVPIWLFTYLNWIFLPQDTERSIAVVSNLSFPKALGAFALQILIPFILLTISYFFLKKRLRDAKK